MGDTSDLILLGIVCMSCGEFIDGITTGYPRTCEDCKDQNDFET